MNAPQSGQLTIPGASSWGASSSVTTTGIVGAGERVGDAGDDRIDRAEAKHGLRIRFGRREAGGGPDVGAGEIEAVRLPLFRGDRAESVVEPELRLVRDVEAVFGKVRHRSRSETRLPPRVRDAGVLRPAPTFDFDVVGGVELRLRLEWHVEVRDDDQHFRLVRRGEDVRLMLGARAGTHYATAISTCSAPAKPSEVKNFAKSLRRFCLRSTIVSTNVSAI